jgi:glyoxylase-like metal-dependent hydrolase (beta-lactamase superfamily II)
MSRFLSASLISIAFVLASASLVEARHKNHQHGSDKAKAEEKAPDISTKKLADNFYLLFGPGGNVGVSTGEDGVYVIDDKFSRFADQIIYRIREVTGEPIRYVLNTHYHGDHTGGNVEMKETGATIMAHDNVRKRMGMTFENKTWGRTVEAVDEALWPTLTFSDTATLHFNGQTVKAIHIPNAHTDGDSIVHFAPANIIHMGDNYFNGMFPYVDVDGGGTLQGMIRAQETAIALADDETQIIPGHGPMATKADLENSRDILKDILMRVKTAKDRGLSMDETVKAVTLDDYKSLSSFINQENMVKTTYRSLEAVTK